MTMKFKTKYDTIGRIIAEPVSLLPSMTDESFKRECDIDFIISNFVQRGIEPPQTQVDYGKQFTSDDFIKSLDTVTECKSAFECLPALEKERFNNSVTNFLDFISNPSNLKESYEKGYINPDSVDLHDVYPEKFNKEITEPNLTNNGGTNIPSSNGSVISGVNEATAQAEPAPDTSSPIQS